MNICGSNLRKRWDIRNRGVSSLRGGIVAVRRTRLRGMTITVRGFTRL